MVRCLELMKLKSFDGDRNIQAMNNAISNIANESEMTKLVIKKFVPFIKTNAFPVRETEYFSEGNSLSITAFESFLNDIHFVGTNVFHKRCDSGITPCRIDKCFQHARIAIRIFSISKNITFVPVQLVIGSILDFLCSRPV